MIRKTFTSAHEPNSKRNFCGYCGTHLTYWREIPEDEANYVNVTVGSLYGQDLGTLAELGLLPDEVSDSDVEKFAEPLAGRESSITQMAKRDDTVQRRVRRGAEGDMTWMEELIDGSRLGRLQKRRRGIGRNTDGTTTVEWEITEVIEDGSEPEPGAGRGKRKLGEIALGVNAHMQL